MCYRTTCARCGRPSYGGCGLHIESVLGDVKPEERCCCPETTNSARAASSGSWFDVWLGRKPRGRS